MVITIEYDSGRVTQFDTGALTTSAPFDGAARRSEGQDAKVVMTRLDLRADLLFKQGDLRVDVWYYSAFPDKPLKTIDDYGFDQPCANLAIATSIVLATARGLERATRILRTSGSATEVVAWRQGSGRWLINGERLRATSMQYGSDSSVSDKTILAINTAYAYHCKHPHAPDAEIANAIGFPNQAYAEMMAKKAKEILEEEAATSECDDEPSGTKGTSLSEEGEGGTIDDALFDVDQDFDDEDEDE